MEVKELLDEVRARFETAIAVEIHLGDEGLTIIAREDGGYPEYILKQYEHYSDLKLLTPNEDIWE